MIEYPKFLFFILTLIGQRDYVDITKLRIDRINRAYIGDQNRRFRASPLGRSFMALAKTFKDSMIDL